MGQFCWRSSHDLQRPTMQCWTPCCPAHSANARPMCTCMEVDWNWEAVTPREKCAALGGRLGGHGAIMWLCCVDEQQHQLTEGSADGTRDRRAASCCAQWPPCPRGTRCRCGPRAPAPFRGRDTSSLPLKLRELNSHSSVQQCRKACHRQPIKTLCHSRPEGRASGSLINILQYK